MEKLGVFLLSFLFIVNLNAQNLIANYSFEEITACPVAFQGCNGLGNVTLNITSISSVDVVLEPVTLLDCNNVSTTLDASATPNLAIADNYGWVGPGGFSSPLDIIDVDDPGWYIFSADFGTGCVSKDSIEVMIDIITPDLLETGVNSAGFYQLLVTDISNGCTAVAQTEVVQSSDFPGSPVLFWTEPSCLGDLAILNISEVTGGAPPYLYSIDGGLTFSANNIFTSLSPDLYQVLIQDSDGCEYAESVLIPEPVELMLDLSPEFTLEYGTNEVIHAEVNIPLDQIAHIQWTPAYGLSCTDCLTPSITASQSLSYYLTVIDVKGCEVNESIFLKVEKDLTIYIPSAFSPNGDGKK